MQTNDTAHTRVEQAKKFWDLKGSWVLLALIAFACFMGGSGFQAWTHNDSFRVQQASFDAKETYYRGRIKELNEFIMKNINPSDSTAKVLANSQKDLSQTINKLADKVDKLDTAKGEDNGKDNR
jgi:hypothetical protein